MRKILMVIVSIPFLALPLSSQEMRTIIYYEDDSTLLEMDVFVPDVGGTALQPLLLYVHGGGFAGGDRTSGYPVCRHVAQKGILSATISYTLHMKDQSFSCDGILSEKIKAIRYGANNLWLATAWFLDHAEEFNIDTEKIMIAGSSAGGETVLHAQYWDRELMNWYDRDLPLDFSYAAVIAGAGAIMDLNLIRADNMVPTMMFHGPCDLLVPYGTAAHHYCDPTASGWLMLFGSHSIYEHILSLVGAAQLYTYCGGGHEYSGILFDQEPQATYEFIRRVLSGEIIQEHRIVKTGKNCDRSSTLSFCRQRIDH